MRCLSVAFALLLCSCAARQQRIPLDLPGIPQEVDPSLAIMTANGQGGHGCPVDGVVFTARHVMWNKEEHRFEGATWSSRGRDGVAFVVGVSSVQDIVVLSIEDGVVTYLPRGWAAVGDLVFWFEYDFRTRANGLRARRMFAKVLRIVARQYVLDGIPTGGGSGGCLINERGEAVGLIAGGWLTNDKGAVGVAPFLPKPVVEQ